MKEAGDMGNMALSQDTLFLKSGRIDDCGR